MHCKNLNRSTRRLDSSPLGAAASPSQGLTCCLTRYRVTPRITYRWHRTSIVHPIPVIRILALVVSIPVGVRIVLKYWLFDRIPI